MCVFSEGQSNACMALEKFLTDVSPYGEVKCIRSDNGAEFINKSVSNLLVKYKIKHEKFLPYSPHQNGTAETHYRTLFETARYLFIASGVDESLSLYAVLAAKNTGNRCYNLRLHNYETFRSILWKKTEFGKISSIWLSSFCVEHTRKLDKAVKNVSLWIINFL